MVLFQCQGRFRSLGSTSGELPCGSLAVTGRKSVESVPCGALPLLSGWLVGILGQVPSDPERLFRVGPLPCRPQELKFFYHMPLTMSRIKRI